MMESTEGRALRKQYLQEYLELSGELREVLRDFNDFEGVDVDRIEACVDNRDVVIEKLKDLDLRFPVGDDEKAAYSGIFEEINKLESGNIEILEEISAYFRNEAGKQKKMSDGLSAYWAQQGIGDSGQVFER